MRPMGKLNASLGENNLLRFLRDQNLLVWSGPELQLFLGSSRQVPHVFKNTKEILYSCGDDRGFSRKTCPCIVDEVCWPQLSMLKIAFQSDSLKLQLPTNFVRRSM